MINRQDIEALEEYHPLLESIIELQQQVNLPVTQHDIDFKPRNRAGLLFFLRSQRPSRPCAPFTEFSTPS